MMRVFRRHNTATLVHALLLALLALVPVTAPAADQGGHSDTQVMQAFAQQQEEEGEAVKITDQEKRLILFIMGFALLVLLLTTAMLGVAMAVYGKQVFVAHMIFAGFSVTLAIAHSIVAIVWFFPFSGP